MALRPRLFFANFSKCDNWWATIVGCETIRNICLFATPPRVTNFKENKHHYLPESGIKSADKRYNSAGPVCATRTVWGRPGILFLARKSNWFVAAIEMSALNSPKKEGVVEVLSEARGDCRARFVWIFFVLLLLRLSFVLPLLFFLLISAGSEAWFVLKCFDLVFASWLNIDLETLWQVDKHLIAVFVWLPNKDQWTVQRWIAAFPMPLTVSHLWSIAIVAKKNVCRFVGRSRESSTWWTIAMHVNTTEASDTVRRGTWLRVRRLDE